MFLIVNIFLKFRSNKVQKCGSSCLKQKTHVSKCKAIGLFWELGRELHRNNPFQRKLYGKSAIEQRLPNFMFSSAKLQDFFEKLVKSSTETVPSCGSFIEKRNWAKASNILIAHNYGSFRFRRSNVWELSIGALNPCFQVQSFRTFSEIGRELHRRSLLQAEALWKKCHWAKAWETSIVHPHS